MNNTNPLYKLNENRYNLILDVIIRLDLSYLYASGGQMWEFNYICNGDKQLASKYYKHWNKIYPKLEDMVQNKLMFDKADIILSTDPVLIAIQKSNYSLGRSKSSMKDYQKEALYYYNLERKR